jgi:membrane protease YdiL (CAAX protease family)
MNVTLVLEAALLLCAAIWIQVGQIEMLQSFRFNKQLLLIGLLSGVGTASSGFVILGLNKLFGNAIKWMSSLSGLVFREVAPLFADLKFFDIFLLAVSSGFCEEVFFRGAMQSQIGLVGTSILFGLFHCPSPRHLTYGLWALAAGLFLGYLMNSTGSLWVPIIAHALSNFIVIVALRYFVKPLSKESG